jgi:hypothetical protein
MKGKYKEIPITIEEITSLGLNQITDTQESTCYYVFENKVEDRWMSAKLKLTICKYSLEFSLWFKEFGNMDMRSMDMVLNIKTIEDLIKTFELLKIDPQSFNENYKFI